MIDRVLVHPLHSNCLGHILILKDVNIIVRYSINNIANDQHEILCFIGWKTTFL